MAGLILERDDAAMWGAEPGRKSIEERRVGRLTYPGNVPVRPDKHSRGCWDVTEDWEFPRTSPGGLDVSDSVLPGSEDAASRLTEVHENGPCLAEKRIDPPLAIRGV